MEFPNTTTAIISFLLAFGATVLVVFATAAATSTTISAKRALEMLLPGCCATATTPANKKNSIGMEIDLEYGLEYVVVQGPDDFASDCDWRDAYATVNRLMDYESRFDCDALEFAGDELEQDDSFGAATVVMGLRPVAVSASSSVAISTGNGDIKPIVIVVDVEDEQEESEDATMTDDSEEQQQISAAVESETEVSTANDSSDAHEEDEHAAVDIEYLDSDEASNAGTTNSDEPAQDDNAAADVVHLNGADEHVQDDNETADLVNLGGDDEFAESDEIDIELEEQTDKDDDRAAVEAVSLDSIRFNGVDSAATDFSVSSSTTASLISSPRSECDLSVATDDEDAGDDEEELEVRVDETAKPRESNIVRALDQFDWNDNSHLVLEDSDDDESDDDEHESEDDDEEDDGIALAPRVVRSHKAETKMLAVQSNNVINTRGELVEIPLDASPSVLFHPDDIVDRTDCCAVQ